MVWLRRIFLKHVVQQRPVLLLTDGHKSHMTLDAIDTCRDNGVILLVSQDLADILATPSSDAAVAKWRTKRIVGARELTANDYSEMLREDQRKKDQLAEEKKRKSKERERKKKEMEEKKKIKTDG